MQPGLPFGESPKLPTSSNKRPQRRVSRGSDDSISPSALPVGGFHFVRHRRARRYLIRVEHDGTVRVTIPRGGSKREAEEFVGRQTGWIADQRARLRAPTMLPEEKRAVQADAEVDLPARLRELAAVHALVVTRVSIRNQRTRWGSCGRDGHICLNWRLVLMPAWVRDYVLIHELMHLRRLDHSPAYWRLVAAACPEYRDARRWLRENGAALR